MKIKVRKKEKQYAQVHKNLLFNEKLSLKAKGLGAILECYSDDFELTKIAIIAKSKDEEKSTKTAIKELELNNYLFRVQTREKGQFLTIWIFDSEFLSIDYVENILNTLNEIIPITEYTSRGTHDGYPIMDLPKRQYPKCTTYNNTNTEPSNLEYFQMMYEVEEEKKKKPRAYDIKPKETKHKQTSHDTA